MQEDDNVPPAWRLAAVLSTGIPGNAQQLACITTRSHDSACDTPQVPLNRGQQGSGRALLLRGGELWLVLARCGQGHGGGQGYIGCVVS